MRLNLVLAPFRLLISEIVSAVNLIQESSGRPAESRPGETVRLFVRHVDQGRYKEALRLLPDAVVAAVGANRLESILCSDTAEIRTRGGVAAVEVVSDSWDLHNAQVNVNIRYADGSVDVEDIQLRNEKGAWKIDMMR